MNLFVTIKAAISVKQTAEQYGLKVGRNGMTCCPFHNDRHPSLKLNDDYFFCFGCGAKGDVIDFVARLFNLTSYEAAQKLAADFGLDPKPPTATAMVKPKRPYIRQFREDEMMCFRVLTDYLHLLEDWKVRYTHRYVEQWQTMRSENIGLLFWGGVGTGKSFLAGCIANALMAQEVPVCMTNFAHILNELNNSFSGRNEVVERLCRYPLLIIDDFGMERGTEYALEQIYNIVDSRYRSRKPLIVTTNLTLDEIRHPQDTAHARIYDRLLEMCVPISCIGISFRKETAQEKLERLKVLIG